MATDASNHDAPGCASVQPTSHKARVPELWFEDGGVIIQAGSLLYRVFQGILIARSNVFNDMMKSCTIPPPTSSQSSEMDTMDGVPLLRIQDGEKDVTHFLKAVFDSGYFEPYPYKTTFQAIAGVLRLSHKYDVGYLQKRALNHLFYAYPNTLSRWDLRGQITAGYDREPEILEAFTVVELALEVDAQWLLPAAVYKCCTYPVEVILALRDDAASSDYRIRPTFPTAQKLCLSTWPKICASYHELYGHLHTTTCIDWPKCLAYLDHTAMAYSNRARTWESKNDPLDSLDNKYWASLKVALCRTCFQESKKFYEKWRSDLWLELPLMMGLKGWNAVNNMIEQ